MIEEFTANQPTVEDFWRSVILFGRNVASYKFALARALLELKPNPDQIVTLEDLALPYALEICRHLKLADRQGTFASSKFLEACHAANHEELSLDDLRKQTVQFGFNDVLQAFHVVGSSFIPLRFYNEERQGRKRGIRVTSEFTNLILSPQMANLPHEVESRWRLVETAWALRCSPRALEVQHEPISNFIYVDFNGRKSITGVRPALNGYQKGHCFYCFRHIAIEGPDIADTDHFFPICLKSHVSRINLDGIWNLVLACRECNRGPSGKHDQLASPMLLARLSRRNEFLIDSHHPLRETLMAQTGASKLARRQFLLNFYATAKALIPYTWETPQLSPPMF